MENTQIARPWLVCAFTLALGIAGMTAGIAMQLPTTATETEPAAGPAEAPKAAIAPQPASRDDLKSFADRTVASHPSTSAAAAQTPGPLATRRPSR
jgi:hypothetical protein